MIDRTRALNWWTGRISDADLAEWTGMEKRAVAIVLKLPWLRDGVTGGGRGSRTTRRIDAKVRNAVAMIQALSEAGLSFELAANVVGSARALVESVAQVIDYWEPSWDEVPLGAVDPKGGWLPTDVVPENVWGRFAFPCRDVDDENPGWGDIVYVEPQFWEPNTSAGTMFKDRSDFGLPNLELARMVEKPIYCGEIDYLGFYAPDAGQPDAAPGLDDHVLIVNGRLLFHRHPKPSAVYKARRITNGYFGEKHEMVNNLISAIGPDGKTVTRYEIPERQEEFTRTQRFLDNPRTKLNVNMTQAVREMKRRALGLRVMETPTGGAK